MDIKRIELEMEKVELELATIEKERDKLIEKLEDMREKRTVYSCFKSRHQRTIRDLVIVPSHQSINNGLVLSRIYEITSIKELCLCIFLHMDTPLWELSRKVLVLKFGEDNVCEAENRIDMYLDYLEEQKDK